MSGGAIPPTRSKHLKNQDLNKIFQTCLNDSAFQEVLDLVKNNSKGKIWIIGGFIYRNIVSKLNNTDPYNYDIDFIVEKKNKTLKKVNGWRIENNSYNNPNYVNDKHKTSFTDIRKAIRVSGMTEPTIDAFILDTPLNIQSIAYDLRNNKLLGEIGVKGLINKVVKVNNREQANFYAKRKGKTLNQIIAEKAQELGFKAIFS